MPPRQIVRVSFGPDPTDLQTLDFDKSFRIGRAEECDVRIRDEYVSRVHAEVAFENGQWWVRDLQSGNGLFIGDRRVERAALERPMTLRLGMAGPTLALQIEQFQEAGQSGGDAQPPSPPSTPPQESRQMPELPSDSGDTGLVQRYFGKVVAGETLGERTVMIRRAYARVHRRQRLTYGWIIGVLLLLVLASGGYTLYLHRQAARNKALTQQMFYSMKALDVEIAGVEGIVESSNSQRGNDEIRKLRNRRNQEKEDYDRFLNILHVYDPKLTPQRQLIMRVARIFGESETSMPPDFTVEVENYIRKWQSSDRFPRDIAIAKERGYITFIYHEFVARDLPPQFFYLALQESNFDPYAIGPPTRSGIAKGMWQFIPKTGADYGLRIGPLVDLPRADPADGRNHYDLATTAAALYIRDLYSTDAQASGLLVMACYNWGEDSVLPLVRSMAENPRERNFWQLWTKYRGNIPRETYDYVLYIFSAAVIGENPRLFGFDFDNPLLDPKNQ